MKFLNNIHKNNYIHLTQTTRIHKDDVERKVLFYIVSGNDDLFRKKFFIYDFDENCIKIDCLDSTDVDFSSSSKNLIRIGFNLYNGYMDDFMNPLWILFSLDSMNFILLIHAIRIRFNNKTSGYFLTSY